MLVFAGRHLFSSSILLNQSQSEPNSTGDGGGGGGADDSVRQVSCQKLACVSSESSSIWITLASVVSVCVH